MQAYENQAYNRLLATVYRDGSLKTRLLLGSDALAQGFSLPQIPIFHGCVNGFDIALLFQCPEGRYQFIRVRVSRKPLNDDMLGEQGQKIS